MEVNHSYTKNLSICNTDERVFHFNYHTIVIIASLFDFNFLTTTTKYKNIHEAKKKELQVGTVFSSFTLCSLTRCAALGRLANRQEVA